MKSETTAASSADKAQVAVGAASAKKQLPSSSRPHRMYIGHDYVKAEDRDKCHYEEQTAQKTHLNLGFRFFRVGYEWVRRNY